MIPIGSKVEVKFNTGHFNGHFYRAGWRVGTVTGHSRIGERHIPGGYSTYDVTLRDGNIVTHCDPRAVRLASGTKRRRRR